MKLKFILVLSLLTQTILAQKPTQDFSKIHAGYIVGIKFSPAGNLMASFANDSNIIIWETNPLKVKGVLKGHLKKINTLDFSPDGSSLVSGSDDGTIRLWDLSTMTSYWKTTDKMRFFETSKDNKINAVCFSPKGKYVLATSLSEKFHLFQINNRNNIESIDDYSLTKVSKINFITYLNSDNEFLINDMSDGLQVYHAQAKYLSRRGNAFGGALKGVAVSSSKSKVCGEYSGRVVSYSIKDGNALLDIPCKMGFVASTAFSPDENFIATSGNNGATRIWNVKTKEEVHLYTTKLANNNNSTSVAFTPDGKSIVVGFQDGTIQVYEAIYSSNYIENKPVSVPESVSIQTIQTDPITKPELIIPTGHVAPIFQLEFDKTGSYLLSSGSDKSILWNLKSGKPIRFFDFQNTAENTGKFSDNYKYVLGVKNNKYICCDIKNGSQLICNQQPPIISKRKNTPAEEILKDAGQKNTISNVNKYKCSYGAFEIKIYDSTGKQIYYLQLNGSSLTKAIVSENDSKTSPGSSKSFADALKIGAEISTGKISNPDSLKAKKNQQKAIMDNFKNDWVATMKNSIDPTLKKITNVEFCSNDSCILIDYNKGWPELFRLSDSKLIRRYIPLNIDKKDSLFSTKSKLTADNKQLVVFQNGTIVSSGTHTGYVFDFSTGKQIKELIAPVQIQHHIDNSTNGKTIRISGKAADLTSGVMFYGGPYTAFYKPTENKFFSDKYCDNFLIFKENDIDPKYSINGNRKQSNRIIETFLNDNVNLTNKMLPDSGKIFLQLLLDSSQNELNLFFAPCQYAVYNIDKNKIVKKGDLFSPKDPNHTMVINFELSPNGKCIGFNSKHEQTVNVYDKSKDSITFSYKFPNSSSHFEKIKFNSTGKGVFIWNSSSILYYSDYTNSVPTFQFENILPSGPSITNIQISQNDQYLLIYYDNDKFKLIDCTNQSNPEVFKTTGSPLKMGAFESFNFSADSRHVCIQNENNIAVFETASGKLLYTFLINGKIEYFDFDKNKVITTGNGMATFYSILPGKEQASLILIGEKDYMFLLPDLSYCGTKNAAHTLAFVKDFKRYSFDQFDLLNNRPDKVLLALGEPDTMRISASYQAYQRRLLRSGLTEEMLKLNTNTPETILLNESDLNKLEKTDLSSIIVKAAFKDTKAELLRAVVRVNEVPLNGKSGFPLKGNSYTLDINVPLSTGMNRIEVSCVNNQNIESYREEIMVEYIPKVKTKKTLYLIAICTENDAPEPNSGLTDFAPLEYSISDGRAFINLFNKTRIINQFTKVSVDTLYNENATREKIISLRSKLDGSSPDDEVLVLFSGHGFVAASNKEAKDFYFVNWDIDRNNPLATGLSFSSIDSLLDGIPARKRLVFLDACQSGEIDLLKSGDSSLVNPYEKSEKSDPFTNALTENYIYSIEFMKELFNDVSNASGTIVFSASTSVKNALELNGHGALTQSLLAGLGKLEADNLDTKDGKINVNELKLYLPNKVEKITNKKQRSTMRQELIENDWVVY